jgi:hypothetical protein
LHLNRLQHDGISAMRWARYLGMALLLLALPLLTGWVQQPCNYFPLSRLCGGTGQSSNQGIGGSGACSPGLFVNAVVDNGTPICGPTSTPAPTPKGYLSFQSNQIGSGGALGSPPTISWQAIKLTSAITIDNCEAAWSGAWSGCSPFPTMAVYDMTATRIICAQQVDGTGSAGTVASLTNTTAASGDVLAIVNDGAGAGCTASNGQMIAFGLAYH